jgi:hypothetical protein
MSCPITSEGVFVTSLNGTHINNFLCFTPSFLSTAATDNVATASLAGARCHSASASGLCRYAIHSFLSLRTKPSHLLQSDLKPLIYSLTNRADGEL